MSIQFRLTKADFIESGAFYTTASGKGRRRIMLLVCLAGAGAVVYLLRAQSALSMLLGALAFVPLLGLAVYGPEISRRLVAGRLYERNKARLEDLAVSWSEAGLTVAAPTGSTAYGWDQFLSWAENEKLLVLYLAANVSVILPKRAFIEPAVLEDLRQQLAEQGVRRV
jgi:hypothetical protein